MPWINDVNGLVQAWYSGNEAGNALSDIVFGKVNPSGRLPLTFPVRMEDVPSFMNLRSENGKIHYREDLFVGYKHYQAQSVAPLFAFGFGLSYTTFAFSNFSIGEPTEHGDSIQIKVIVEVENTGSVLGSEVVQLYVTYPELGVTTPKLQLKGFAKIKDLVPGRKGTAEISLDKYALSFWDVTRSAWSARAGIYQFHVGSSSNDLPLKGDFELPTSFEWSGL